MDAITLPSPGRRRRYSAEFKAQIVETCNRPGTSVAAIARLHNINDNIVHRWIREAEQAASAAVLSASMPARSEPDELRACAAAPFVPVQVSTGSPERIHMELIKKDLTVRLDWPASQSASCAQALLMLLR